jgi:hypothetical protein
MKMWNDSTSELGNDLSNLRDITMMRGLRLLRQRIPCPLV